MVTLTHISAVLLNLIDLSRRAICQPDRFYTAAIVRFPLHLISTSRYNSLVAAVFSYWGELNKVYMMNEIERQQSRYVTRAAARFRQGKISRRQFLRLCAEAGFGFTSLHFLNACTPQPTAPPTPEDIEDTTGPESAGVPGTLQQQFLKEVGGTFSGTTLQVIGEDTPPTRATIEIMQREFIPLTGINVEWQQLPLDEVLTRVVTDTGNELGTHDIFYWDQAWLGRFVNEAVDPQTLLARSDLAYPGYRFEDLLPPLIEGIASYQGRLVGIPFDIPVFIMMYRKDILEALQLSVPTTIPEYMAVIKAIHEELQPEVYGTVGQWKSGHYSLTIDASAWLWAHGGSYFGQEGQPTINDEQAQAAMAYMLELGHYMPPGVTNWDWGGEANSFAQGQAGIFIQAGEWFSLFDDPAQSKVVGLVEAAPCPVELALRSKDETSFDEIPGISRQGGSCLAISKYSKNVEAAWVFLQWVTSPDVTTRASLLGGGASPIRYSNYEDPRIKDRARVTVGTTRFFDVTLDAILHRMGTEPHLPAWASLSVDSFAVELGKMTTGQQDIKTTLDNMAQAATGVTQ